MELEAIYENTENEDMKDTCAPQIQSRCQDEGKAQKQSKQKVSFEAEMEMRNDKQKTVRKCFCFF